MGTKHAGVDVDTVRHCQDRPDTGNTHSPVKCEILENTRPMPLQFLK